jgi:hypothetical protein
LVKENVQVMDVVPVHDVAAPAGNAVVDTTAADTTPAPTATTAPMTAQRYQRRALPTRRALI